MISDYVNTLYIAVPFATFLWSALKSLEIEKIMNSDLFRGM